MDSLPQPQEPSKNDKLILTGLSERLKQLLTSDDDERSISEIAGDESMMAQCRTALPALRNRAILPAGEHGVREVIGRRFALYPQAQRSEEEWSAWWLDYVEALRDIPANAIEAAMKTWVAKPDNEFMPKPGWLRETARHSPFAAATAYLRAKKISEMSRPRVSKPKREELAPETKTLETRETVMAMAADFTKSIADLPKVPTDRGGKILERERPSALYRSLMEQGLQQSRQAPPTVMQRIAATLDEKSQGRLAEGRAITPLMIEVLERQRSGPRPS